MYAASVAFLFILAGAPCTPKSCCPVACFTHSARTSHVLRQENLCASACTFVRKFNEVGMCGQVFLGRAPGRPQGSEHGHALTLANTPSSGNGMCRRCRGVVVKALRTCTEVANTQVFVRTGDSSVSRRTTYVISGASDSKKGICSS